MKRWDAIIKHIKEDGKENDILHGAEVGVYTGKTSRALLTALPKLHLYMVDRWEPYTDEERARRKKSSAMVMGDNEFWIDVYKKVCGIRDDFPARACVMRMTSLEAAKDVRENFSAKSPLDFVFIDGDHKYESVCADIDAWLPLIKSGGWICGHDINRPDVKKAVCEKLGESNYTKDADNTWFCKVQ